MASGVVVASPLAQNFSMGRKHNRLSLSPGFSGDGISPRTTRHAQLTANSMASTASIMSPSFRNNDEQEKQNRRRSRLLEHHQTLSSPANERRKSMTVGGMTNNQLADQYDSWIKLSAENKINAKNAFGLHLIDYMSELLRKKDSNFQVASSTLDASAKIYAGRVDAIHSETYKVLSGLGRGQSNQKQGEADEDGEFEAPEGENTDTDQPERRKKRNRVSNTIETNTKNLNVTKFDLEFDVDPFFHHTSAKFDEGGAGGLLLSHLSILDDSSQLVLDSNTLATQTPFINEPKTQSKYIDMKGFSDMFERLTCEETRICPSLVDFEFTNWNREEEDTFMTALNKAAPSSEHAFDIDAEPEPLPTTDDDVALDLPAENIVMEDDDDDAGGSDVANSSDQSIMVGDSKEAHIVQHTVSSMTQGDMGELIQALASEPSDYSYFNNKVLQTWAGPSHWKLKSGVIKDRSTFILTDTKIKTKTKKEAIVLEYTEELNMAPFKKTRASTTLTKATLDKYSITKTTLPENLHYDGDELFKPCIKPLILIKRQVNVGAGDEEVAGTEYNFDNSNDRDNFCPDLQTADGDDDDDMDDGGGFNFTSQDVTQSQPASTETTMIGSDGLITQPKKVAKIDIGYAKVAKKMDVKRLKATMWSYLTKPSPNIVANGDCNHSDNDKENQGGPGDETVFGAGVHGSHTFQSLCCHLPEKLPKTMASNLSVPIAFVGLLHLANEKRLCIKSDDAMSDLMISQD